MASEPAITARASHTKIFDENHATRASLVASLIMAVVYPIYSLVLEATSPTT